MNTYVNQLHSYGIGIVIILILKWKFYHMKLSVKTGIVGS